MSQFGSNEQQQIGEQNSLTSGKKKNKSEINRNYYRATINAANSKKSWTEDEERFVLTKSKNGLHYNDREISAMIGRSMKAIQNKRGRLKGTLK